MLHYVGRRLILAVPTLIGLTLVVFVLTHVIPGDPAVALVGENASREEIERARSYLQVDRPLHEQYLSYVAGLLTGSLGVSKVTGAPFAQEFASRFPATVELTIAALLLATLAGVPFGRFAARHANTWVDGLATALSLGGISIPVFVLGLSLQYVLAVNLGVLPATGRLDPRLSIAPVTGLLLIDTLAVGSVGAFVDAIRHLLLPALTLGSIPFAYVSRLTRASVLDVSREDYVRTARARGLTERRISARHIMPNAWLPVVTMIGLQVGTLLAGAVITETVFAWNGVGSWVVQAIHNHDYVVVQSAVLVFAGVFLLVNLAVDLSYAFLDPRIRYS